MKKRRKTMSKRHHTSNKKNSTTSTNTKKIKKIIYNSEQRYRNLYESSPDLLRSIDLNEKIIDCNQTYVKSLGYSKKEIIGKSAFEHISEKSYQSMKKSISMWKKTGKILNQEIWLKRKNGSAFPTLLSGTNLYDLNNKIIGRTVAFRNISKLHESRNLVQKHEKMLLKKFDELKTAYKYVLKIEERYKNLYENSPIAYRTIDLNGVILDCNNTYASLLDYPKKEIVGKTIFDHIYEQSYENMKETYQSWLKHGNVSERLIWLKGKNNNKIPVMLSATSIYDNHGKLIGSNTAMRDLSAAFEAKQEIEDLKIERIMAIGELSARIAHDMRNPLSILKNSLELVKLRKSELDKTVQKHLDMAERAVYRMAHQIEEVLDYVSPKPLKLENTSLQTVLNSSLERIRIPEDIRINMPKEDIEVTFDPLKMEIMFVNLISNAIQAMNNLGTIDIRSKKLHDRIEIEVEDSGPGIPVELMKKIFDPLFTTRQIGTGLGLPSCRSIIEKHGGIIEAVDNSGKGALFRITMPTIQNIEWQKKISTESS